jgi:hypothetical protein
MISVVVITGLFFVFGIAVGVIVVIAMSALRRYKWGGPSDGLASGPSDGPDEQPPDLDSDGSLTEAHPWWRTRGDN